MKQNFSSFFLLFSMLLFLGLTGCSNDEPASWGPSELNELTVNRERVGVGQPVTISCTIPAQGSGIKSVKYSWVYPSGLSEEAVVENGKSSVTVFPNGEGKYTITFSASYTFTSADKDGNLFKKLESKKIIDVVKCDVRTSFWGDNVAETLLNCPNLQKYTGDDVSYFGLFRDDLSAVSDATISVLYSFQDDKLSKITEASEKEYSETYIGGYYRNYMILRTKLSRIYGSPLSDEITWTSGSTENVDAGNTSDGYINQIGEALYENEASLKMIFKNAKTEVIVEAFKNKNNKVVYIRTYTPVN